MGFWKKLGKIATIAAPIVAAPFTGGASLALLGAASGAASAKLSGAGWKGTLAGAGLGAIPGVGKAAGIAKGAAPSANMLSKAMSTYGKVQPYMKGAQQVAGILGEQDQPRMRGYPQQFMPMQRPSMNRNRLYGGSPIQSYYGRQQY